MKFYFADMAENRAMNCVLLGIGLLFHIGIIVMTNVLGLHISFLSDKLLHWSSNNNPFLLMISLALFNIARNAHFKSRFINYISGFSLLIYIIHEDILLRSYYRPCMWAYIHQNYGYDYIVAWVFVLVVLIFLFSVIAAMMYNLILHKVVLKMSESLFKNCKRMIEYIESYALRLH